MTLSSRAPAARRGGPLLLLLGLAAVASPAAAQAPAGVPAKAAPCVACHGDEGRSTTADVPSLAGQPKQFITTQLVMFREGNRKNEVMNAMAAPLSNAEISELGSYFTTRTPAAAGSAVAAASATASRGLAEKLGCVTCHGT